MPTSSVPHLVAFAQHRETISQALVSVSEDIKSFVAEGLASRSEGGLLVLMGSIIDDKSPLFRTYGLTIDAETNELLALDVRGLTALDQLYGEERKRFCLPFEELGQAERYSLLCILSFRNYRWTTFKQAEADARKYGQPPRAPRG